MEKLSLSALPLFRGLTDAEADAAVAALRARRKPFVKGEVLLEAGQCAPALGVVLAGRVIVFSSPVSLHFIASSIATLIA